MAYAHQGVEIKPYPGVAPAQKPEVTAAAAPTETTKAADYVPPPSLLTRKGADILVRVERMLEDAAKALGTQPAKDRNAAAASESAVAAAPEATPSTGRAARN